MQTQTSQVRSVPHAFLTCMMVSHLELGVVACEVPVKLAEQLFTCAFTQWRPLVEQLVTHAFMSQWRVLAEQLVTHAFTQWMALPVS